MSKETKVEDYKVPKGFTLISNKNFMARIGKCETCEIKAKNKQLKDLLGRIFPYQTKFHKGDRLYDEIERTLVRHDGNKQHEEPWCEIMRTSPDTKYK